MKKWLPILVLGLTQFVMVLDGTVMNVSITEVVGDLGTTTSNMQLAIATFTLTMAALMLAGAGLGTRLGLRRTFVIGNVIYAIGSLTTAFAPGFAALFVGWSLVEGLGAALVVPAIAALAAVNYSGRERAMAYAVLGGIAGAASAAGPLIGGWMTTYLSWRWVFGFETLIILLLVLPLHRRIVDQRPTATQGRFDWPGVLLSALSMGLIVLALVSASTWGLIQPINPPFTVWGFSPTMPMVVVGALVAWGFISWQEHLQTHGGAPLVGLDLLSLASLRAGLASQLVLYFIVAGTFFVIPLYLQTVLELNALESGIRMLPMSVCLFLVALIGSRLASHRSPRQLIRSGLLIACGGLVLMISAIRPEADSLLFTLAMASIGIGIGLAISQIGNVNLSSADQSRSTEIGGMQGTAQNLGASLGVAIAGTALFIALGNQLTTTVNNNPSINPALKQATEAAQKRGIQVVTPELLENYLQQAGVPSDQIQLISDDYTSSKLQALRLGLGHVLVVALLGLPLTRGLPRKPL